MLHWKSRWYWYAVAVSAALVAVAVGPGLWSSEASLAAWFNSWQKELFSTVCHQQINRTISVNGIPMAVCSRCFGVYTSFFAGLLLIPAIPQHTLRNTFIIPILLFAVLLNVVDVVTYATGIWNNMLYSRLIAGALIGLSAAVLLGTSQPKLRFKVK
jgi:uncharacterized membrane protein